MRWPYVGIFFAVGLLTACSSSSSMSAGVSAASAVPTVSNSASSGGSAAADSGSTAPTSAAPSSYAATGTASDSQGDKVTVSINVGSPTALTELNQQNVSACTDVGANLSYDADRTVAIPVQVTATLTSSLATSVTVGLDGTDEVTSGGGVDSNGNFPYWAAESSDVSLCAASGDAIFWNGLAPGQPTTWSGWLIEPEAISPDDPTGSSAKKAILLEPAVDLGLSNGDWEPVLADSHNLVKCAAGVPFGAVIAVDPQIALASGCTTYTGN